RIAHTPPPPASSSRPRCPPRRDRVPPHPPASAASMVATSPASRPCSCGPSACAHPRAALPPAACARRAPPVEKREREGRGEEEMRRRD
ncbi:Os12g0513800, partial [Oryza sativa Japonica Group]